MIENARDQRSVVTHKLISRIDEKIKEDRRFTIDGLTLFFLEILHLVLYEIVGSFLAYTKKCGLWVP